MQLSAIWLRIEEFSFRTSDSSCFSLSTSSTRFSLSSSSFSNLKPKETLLLIIHKSILININTTTSRIYFKLNRLLSLLARDLRRKAQFQSGSKETIHGMIITPSLLVAGFRAPVHVVTSSEPSITRRLCRRGATPAARKLLSVGDPKLFCLFCP